jgi:hypothetical protein
MGLLIGKIMHELKKMEDNLITRLLKIIIKFQFFNNTIIITFFLAYSNINYIQVIVKEPSQPNSLSC